MFKIYDSHVHIHVDRKDAISEYEYYDIESLLKDQKKYGISKSICFLNPFVPELLCDKNYKHKIKIIDGDGNKIKIYCQNCQKVIYYGIDPLRALNVKLLEQSKNIKSIIPFVYLNISNSINEEVLYFEKKYGDLVKGYKIHPKLCSRKISEITINSTKPIIVHTGVQTITSPSDVIKFAENYKGNVILAHCARFSKNDLVKIRETSNLYIDISPFMVLYNSFIKKPDVLYDVSYLEPINSPSKLLHKLIDFIGVDKIVFGTDIPFTHLDEELDFILNCDIIFDNKMQILSNNLSCLLNEEENYEKIGKKFSFKTKKS